MMWAPHAVSRFRLAPWLTRTLHGAWHVLGKIPAPDRTRQKFFLPSPSLRSTRPTCGPGALIPKNGSINMIQRNAHLICTSSETIFYRMMLETLRQTFSLPGCQQRTPKHLRPGGDPANASRLIREHLMLPRMKVYTCASRHGARPINSIAERFSSSLLAGQHVIADTVVKLASQPSS